MIIIRIYNCTTVFSIFNHNVQLYSIAYNTYGRFGHLSTKITKISKHYNSLKSYVFSNLKTESYRACQSPTFDKT